VTIDDLFRGAGEEPAPAQHAARAPQLRWLSLAVGAGVVAGLVFVILRLYELTAPVIVLFVAAMTLIGLLRLVRRLRPPPPSRHAGRYRDDDSLPDGLKLAIDRWDTMLDWCESDVGRYNRRMLPRLGELADERLRLRHGVTRSSDPHKARSILGDELWTQVTTPSRRPPSPRELEQIVSALEKL
jgi:hypothetical protein